MPDLWYPKETPDSVAAANAAAQQALLESIDQSTDATEQALTTPPVLPIGGATEATQQLNNQALGTEGGGVVIPPPGGGTGILGWVRSIREFFQDILSIVGAQRAIKVDVIQTVGGGGGGGDASAANQVAEIALLTNVLAKLIAAPSTEAKQDAEIVAINAIATALGLPLTINLPTGISTEAKQDVIITAIGNLATALSGTLTIGGVVAVSNFPVSQPVTGAFWQATQPVSAAALPLPAGASTESTLTAILAKLIAAPATEATLASILTALSSVTVTGPLTDTELRASPVPVSLSSVPLPTGSATLTEQQTQTTRLTSIRDAVEIMDDWDESDRAKVNPVVGQAGVQGGSGAVSSNTQRVVLATDVALPAGTNAIGKLAPNSGVDIGDVDITSLPKSSSANTPSVITSGGDVLSANSSRKAWGIQNLGTNPLFVRMATGASSTVFHFCLAGGAVSDDGRGASVQDDTYTGIVSATGTSPRFTAFEL